MLEISEIADGEGPANPGRDRVFGEFRGLAPNNQMPVSDLGTSHLRFLAPEQSARVPSSLFRTIITQFKKNVHMRR